MKRWGTRLRFAGYLLLGGVLGAYNIYWYNLSFWLVTGCVVLIHAGSLMENEK